MLQFAALVPHFIEPLTDNEMITVNSSTPVVNMMCRLSDPFPLHVIVQWSHNGGEVVASPRITIMTSMDTAVLQMRNISSLDLGIYRCAIESNNLWKLRRSFTIDGILGKMHNYRIPLLQNMLVTEYCMYL